MSATGLRAAQQKMRERGMGETAIAVFSHYYAELEAGETGLISEDSITGLVKAPHLADMHPSAEETRTALAATATIRLNGGLGTSMGMDRAKSLLPVRDGRSFLEIIIDQVRHTRATYGVALPLILMNSFRTRADALDVMTQYPDLQVTGLPLDFVQNAEPKITQADLMPARWPPDPELEWCPPGHGDIYTVLYESGLLTQLLTQGFRYALVANGDNLGATCDGRVAAWFAASGAPYAAEVCPRTPADLKGGHLAVRRVDGQLILRETAQTAPDEMRFFTDETRHPYAHTNSLWFNLAAVEQALRERRGVLGLPLIRNAKTVDPADPDSPAVYQLETAMGAAIGSFAGATALVVDRDRFLPVKTTNDLLVMRSDAYAMGADAILRLRSAAAPLVDLDSRFFKRISDFEARFPAGPPSLAGATRLSVAGDWTFGSDVTVRGEVVLADPGHPGRIDTGTVLS